MVLIYRIKCIMFLVSYWFNLVRAYNGNEDGSKVVYTVWNPFRSELAAAILGGVDEIWITVVVCAVEFSHHSGRDLVNMAKKGTNVIPIIEDARHPAKYRMLVGMVDVIFSDIAQPDQANCIDSTVPAEIVFSQEVKKLQADQFKPFEQVTLEPFERDHACVVGGYRMPKKQKAAPAS
ncbi:hypothetical protein NL676_023577 [Syzygium grande]|nr:hypothetical protein NL676_023577 [Syzygium grande]